MMLHKCFTCSLLLIITEGDKLYCVVCVCGLSGEKVVQGLYDYSAADVDTAGQDLNFKKGDYMTVISK